MRSSMTKPIKTLPSFLFQNFTDTEVADILSSSYLRAGSFPKETVIFHSGDLVYELGIVQSGSVHIESIDPWGSKSILSNISAGQVFAETYAIAGEPMMVDAVAAENCTILFLDIRSLLCEENAQQTWYPKVLNNILRISVQKNLLLSNRIFCTTPKTIRERVMLYLSTQAAKSGSTTFQIPFNRQQLADYLNLDRSALSKELGKMRDDGLLEFYKNSFKLKAADKD